MTSSGESNGPDYSTKDSGHRREFTSGAKRDRSGNKGRYDLIPKLPLHRLAQLYERGAEKYDDHNWKKGMPLSVYLDCATRHLFQLIDGADDEDHAAAVVFNVFAYQWTKDAIENLDLPPELDDQTPPVTEIGKKNRLKISPKKELTPENKPRIIAYNPKKVMFMKCHECNRETPHREVEYKGAVEWECMGHDPSVIGNEWVCDHCNTRFLQSIKPNVCGMCGNVFLSLRSSNGSR